MTTNSNQLCRLWKDKKALSPALSATIITAAVIVMLLVAVTFVNYHLTGRIAENEFNAMTQFMQTVGLQVDDVAWTIGRTQTVRYASRYGQVGYQSSSLKYTVYANDVQICNFTTGILLFNMPTNRYSMGNPYHSRIFPADRSFLQHGTSAPVGHIFVIQTAPMADGDYIRIVVAPSIRLLNSTITTGGTTRNYYNFYFPILNSGSSFRRTESVTLEGTAVNLLTRGDINNVKIVVEFPKSGSGFDSTFFNFETPLEELNVPEESVLDFYTSEVKVSLGLEG